LGFYINNTVGLPARETLFGFKTCRIAQLFENTLGAFSKRPESKDGSRAFVTRAVCAKCPK